MITTDTSTAPATPNVGRQVLNAALDTKNIVPREEFHRIADGLLDQVIGLLQEFCGPFSRNALIIAMQSGNGMRMGATGTQIDTKVFTKDGINILTGIEYMSPIETYLKSMLVYVGDRVDSTCKDGTTTAILFAAQFLRAMLENISREFEAVRDIPTREMERAYAKLTEQILAICDQRKHTVESIQQMLGATATREDAVGVIAWMQAYTSSSGDVELADAAQQLFRYLPSDSWEHAEFRRQSCETSKRYETLVEDWDYQLRGQSMNLELLNHDNKRSYLQEHTNLLVIPEKIYNGYGFDLRLQAYLAECDRPLVLLCPDIDGETKHGLDMLAQAMGKHLCVLVHKNMILQDAVLGNLDWDLKAIGAMAETELYGLENTGPITSQHVIQDVQVLFRGNEISLYRLYANPNGLTMHPGTYDPDSYPRYTQFLEELKRAIDWVSGLHTMKNPDELSWMRGVYISARQAKKAVLLIGGRSHDQLAAIDVIRDALGATIASLNHGFYVNGPLMLWRVLSEIQAKVQTDSQSETMEKIYFSALWDAICLVLRATRYSAIGQVATSGTDSALAMDDFLDLTKAKYGDLPAYVRSIHAGGEAKQAVLAEYGCPPMQVGQLFKELFDRIGEVLIRFAGTETIIVPGAAWRKE